LDDTSFVRRSIEVNAVARRWLTQELRHLGMQPLDSEANFVLVPLASEVQATGLFEDLLREGVIVRPLKSFGLPSCLRITVGTPEENELCVSKLHRILKAELTLA
jgi:histidinol-phosphate aminotransferase